MSQQQILPHTIKLNQPPVFKGEYDYEIIEAWIFSLENYWQLTGLSDPSQQARFAATLMQNQAALWLRTTGVDLENVTWPSLRQRIRDHFCPADYQRRARDELAAFQQNKLTTSKYIDVFKRIISKIPDITDSECLDRFVRGLNKATQRQVLVEDPPTFGRACQLAERVARLDQVVEQRFNPSASTSNDPHNVGATLQSDVQMALLDLMSGKRPFNTPYTHNKQRGHPYQRGRGAHNNQPRACFVCGKQGHVAAQCWHRAGANNTQAPQYTRGRGRGRYHTPRTRGRGRFNNVETAQRYPQCDFSTNLVQPGTAVRYQTEDPTDTSHMTPNEYSEYMRTRPWSWSPRAQQFRYEQEQEWQNNFTGPPPKN